MTQLSITYATESPNTLIRSARWNQNFNDVRNFINTKQLDSTDNLKDGGVTNATVSATAGIVATKLNLTTIAQIMALSSVIFKQAQGANVASATTTTLGEDGNFFFITGTTTITSITAKQAGTVVFIKFNGILTLTNGSNLKLVADFVTAANDGICLVSDGTNWWEISRSRPNGASFENLANIPASAGIIPAANLATKYQIFTGSGTFTAPAGVTKVYITMCGGGGGGGGSASGGNGAGGGGGGASLLNVPYTVIPANNYTVTIGAGGAGSTQNADSDGGDGGTTSFDTVITAPGGKGGKKQSTGGAGGLGGTSVAASANTAGGVIAISGGAGGTGAGGSVGGAGGASALAPGTAGINSSVDANNAAANSGAGGSGGQGNSSNVKGVGGSGICIVAY